MPTEEEWKRLKKEKNKEIMFGQAVNIASKHTHFRFKSFPNEIKVCFEQIKKAHEEVFNEPKNNS